MHTRSIEEVHLARQVFVVDGVTRCYGGGHNTKTPRRVCLTALRRQARAQGGHAHSSEQLTAV